MYIEPYRQSLHEEPSFSPRIWSLRELLPSHQEAVFGEAAVLYESLRTLNDDEYLSSYKIPLDEKESSGLANNVSEESVQSWIFEFFCTEDDTSMLTSIKLVEMERKSKAN
jgi:hypothetical protein